MRVTETCTGFSARCYRPGPDNRMQLPSDSCEPHDPCKTALATPSATYSQGKCLFAISCLQLHKLPHFCITSATVLTFMLTSVPPLNNRTYVRPNRSFLQPTLIMAKPHSWTACCPSAALRSLTSVPWTATAWSGSEASPSCQSTPASCTSSTW